MLFTSCALSHNEYNPVDRIHLSVNGEKKTKKKQTLSNWLIYMEIKSEGIFNTGKSSAVFVWQNLIIIKAHQV